MTAEVLTGKHAAGGNILPFWRAVYEIARKEVLIFARTKRLYIMGSLFAVGFIGLTLVFANFVAEILGDAADDIFGVVNLSEANAVMAFVLFFPILGAYFFLNLLGIVFTFDGVVREYEDKTLFLLLSRPVSRQAFVLGKFAGAGFTVAAIFLTLGSIAYLVAMLVMGDWATPGDMLRYFLALGIVTLGMLALAAMGLFFSAVARTTTMSMLASLGMWFIVLNLLASSGNIYALTQRDFTVERPWYVLATQYFNPTSSSGPAVKVMIGYDRFGADIPAEAFSFLGVLDLNVAASVSSLLGFLALFLGGTLLLVGRRNFE